MRGGTYAVRQEIAQLPVGIVRGNSARVGDCPSTRRHYRKRLSRRWHGGEISGACELHAFPEAEHPGWGYVYSDAYFYFHSHAVRHSHAGAAPGEHAGDRF